VENNAMGIPILSLITYLPMITALAILFMRPGKRIGQFAAVGTAVNLALSIVALIFYLTSPASANGGVASFDLQEKFVWLPELSIGYHFGVDNISILMVVLTTLLTLISIMVSWNPIQKRVKEYYIALLVLQTGMLGVFVSLDFFLFDIFWELVLLPMALIIGIWGSSNRVYAAIKFFLYTLAGSLLMLVAIVALYLNSNPRTLDVLDLMQQGPTFARDFQNWVFLAFAAAFAVKVPMWPVHTWLPDAHVEAPTAGSIILAGVMLKLGAYGFIRFAMPITPAGAATFAGVMVGLSVIAIIYGALVSLVQPDLKKLVAYSSVSHMGFVTLGLFTGVWLHQLNYGDATQGIDGAIFVMLSHGILTGGLFLCVGAIYNRLHTRQISDMGGLTKPMPRFSVLFMIMMMGSVGLPGLSGFVGEFLTMVGAFRADWVVGAITAFVVILAAWYLLWMFQRVMFGKLTPLAQEGHGHEAVKDVDWIEASTLGVLSALAILMGVFPGPLLEMLHPNTQTLLQTVTAQIPNAMALSDLLPFFK
ncbi:MAG TPA: NADH-quinone oxidoreductase subunit M, partial [Chloroflexia bacterium]|nr:NADH-quinone oxidoreductase subunit M [Chloroflexia bacterium]